MLIHDGLCEAARLFPDRDAVRVDDGAWSYRQLDAVSNDFGHHLRRRGVQFGSRVAVMTSNRVEFLVAVHAISKLGAAAVLLNPGWKKEEVDHAFELTAPAHAIADGAAAELLAHAIKEVIDLDDPATLAATFDGRGEPLALETPPETNDAVFVFSSGTTGLPKAVRHTHRSMSYAIGHWCAALRLSPADRFQVATPPSHILGLLNLLAATKARATVRLHRRFDLDEILTRVAAE
jgi:long-chain acyl-CoA synthetase